MIDNPQSRLFQLNELINRLIQNPPSIPIDAYAFDPGKRPANGNKNREQTTA